MSTNRVPSHEPQTVRLLRASALCSLVAAGLFACSAGLLFAASLQRWVVFRLSHEEFEAEDHLYDYSYPYGEWVNIGINAQLFGVGILILALGVLAMTLGVVALPRTAGRRGVAVIIGIVEMVLAALIAASFGIIGAHALISGLTGTPSPLFQAAALDWVAVVGLVILIVWWAFRSPPAMLACVFLIGATGLGYFVAAFQVAPLLAGYVSHDTTPWTETVVAAWTAVAALAMILAAREAARRGALVANGPVAGATVRRQSS